MTYITSSYHQHVTNTHLKENLQTTSIIQQYFTFFSFLIRLDKPSRVQENSSGLRIDIRHPPQQLEQTCDASDKPDYL
ncbi:hypothetical protein Hanom_Chr01g00001581 [Helianthus anomalus]